MSTTKEEEEKYYARFVCRDWDPNIGFLQSALTTAHLIKPHSKSVGFCLIELFETEEDARDAYPAETPGTLKIKGEVEKPVVTKRSNKAR